MGLLSEIRERCAQVMQQVSHVRMDPERLQVLAEQVASSPPELPEFDPRFHHVETPASTLAFVMTLDAVNFGSGYFPKLRKREGLSGYYTLASALKEQFDRCGPWRAEQLLRLTSEDCAKVFGQDLQVPDLAELMRLFAQAWNELGRFLLERYGGRFAGPLAEADHCAEKFVEVLAQMSFYRDVANYAGLEVPFYKRAQLTASDLSVAPIGEARRRFRDLDRLTLFADNLVPHVLRMEGVLVYDDALVARIERGELLESGSPEEIEIRAGGVHAVEELVRNLKARGVATTAQRLDYWLWSRGQRPEIKAHPRHRTRCVFY